MHLGLGQLLPLLVIGGGFTFTGTVLYGAWLLGRYRGREEQGPAELADVEARLHRVEYAITQTTSALERLEAAHRYTTALLIDPPANAPRLPGRQVTPH